MGKRITDKEFLDWMELKLRINLHDNEGIGVSQAGMTYLSGMAWPNRTIRGAIRLSMAEEKLSEDAAIRAARRSKSKRTR